MNLIGCTNEEQVEKSAPLSLWCVNLEGLV